MRKNEPIAAKRHVGPIPFFNNAGQLLPGQTFLTASSEVFVTGDGGVWTPATADATEIGAGFYDVLVTQAETNFDTYLAVRLSKAPYQDVAFEVDLVDTSLPINVNIGNISSIVNAILDELLSGHAVVGSVADGIAIAAGLLQGNFYMDQTNNTDPNGQTVARARIFRTGVAAAAATDGGVGEGEFATFLITTTYVGVNKIATHRVVRV